MAYISKRVRTKRNIRFPGGDFRHAVTITERRRFLVSVRRGRYFQLFAFKTLHSAIWSPEYISPSTAANQTISVLLTKSYRGITSALTSPTETMTITTSANSPKEAKIAAFYLKWLHLKL